MVTLALVDDHAVVRQALRLMLELEPRFTVVGEAANAREAVALVRRQQPDVLIADLMMPGRNGLQLTRTISRMHGKTRVIVLSMYQDEAFVVDAFRAGAAGFLAKESGYSELFLAIRRVMAGHRYLSSAITETSGKAAAVQDTRLHEPQPQVPHRRTALTAAERAILRSVVELASCGGVAGHLAGGSRSVEAARAGLMWKLGLTTRSDLVRYALRFALRRGTAHGHDAGFTGTPASRRPAIATT